MQRSIPQGVPFSVSFGAVYFCMLSLGDIFELLNHAVAFTLLKVWDD